MPMDRPEAPKWVGWETDEEWELETRAFNFNETWSFEEMQRLVNDLWQQYCAAGGLAADPSEAILKSREEAFGWQPIETAPKDGTWVIVFCPDYKEERVRPASYQSDVGLGEDIWDFAADCYELASSDSAPTLWMPLPSPPAIRQHSQKGER